MHWTETWNALFILVVSIFTLPAIGSAYGFYRKVKTLEERLGKLNERVRVLESTSRER